ncbi:hypothetical protein JAAARDRAFT_621723 [Jaapia argillacea MUCL 33604]|uniref:Potassium transport protein n=1 Tax=Jaapia argillacea MUCL 33604 TaxID=933084 RepID=A0A067Q7J8_9AGAM|nr:hypothetical protein JAAARDRAFT_621723 [Jaapia argillacea MUCL 33604]
MLGTPATVSWVTVYVRRRFFIRHLSHIIDAELERTRARAMRRKEGDPSGARLADSQSYRRTAGVINGKRSQVLEYPDTLGNCSRDHAGIAYPESSSSDTVPCFAGSMAMGIHNDEVHNIHIPSRETSISQTSSSSRPVRTIAEERNQGVPRGIGFTKSVMKPVTVQVAPSKNIAAVGHHETSYDFAAPRRMSASRDEELATGAPEAHFGGFHPAHVLWKLIQTFAPGFYHKYRHAVTMPRTFTFVGVSGQDRPLQARPAPYLSFNAVADRDSHFHKLSREEVEELTGVEYRALHALLWIVPLYYFGILAISFVVIWPYMSAARWKSNFVPPQQHRSVNEVWFPAFIIVAAWANTGMSLVDQNMIPFQTAYPMIFFIILCILAGNTAFPIFLRLMIWTMSRCVPKHSRFHETLHFLLDHPRRCFIYLFPSRQTWFLLTVLIILKLNRPRTFASVCCPYSGFSVRSIVGPGTRCQSSLSRHDKNHLASTEKNLKSPTRYTTTTNWNRASIWGKYLLRHMRRQLSFDMWWLAAALFLLCILERANLNDSANSTWFNIFQLAFEIVSAYGTVGLSLGIPNANHSFSGALHTTSKLVLCAVMLRGRHRGLPVALDRAVMVPVELRREGKGKEIIHEMYGMSDVGGRSMDTTLPKNPRSDRLSAIF